jgi:predicted Zn-dependent peptidase
MTITKNVRVLSLSFFVCGVSVLSAGAAWAGDAPKRYKKPLSGDPMHVTVHRLKNGLTVYLSPNPQDPRISAWIATRAGGAQDPADSTGMAHYLEHMLFKGSKNLGTLDYEAERPHLEQVSVLYEKLFTTTDEAERKAIYKEIDAENQKAAKYAVTNEIPKAYTRLGFKRINAFTSNERTVYVVDLPKNRLEAWAKLESDRFHDPVFRLFQTEIETVFEEKNRSLDNPNHLLIEAFYKALFGDHPYGRGVIGTVEHLKNPSLKKMYAFFDAHYVPNNMAIALAGDFDRKEALDVIEKYFGKWRTKKLPNREARNIEKIKGTKRVRLQYEAEEEVALGWQTVANDHPDADALFALKMVFDNSESGIINLRLNQAQKVKSAGSFHQSLNEGGLWGLWAVTKKGQTLKEAEKLLLETVEVVKDGEFTDEDLKAIVRNFEISQKAELESNESRTYRMTDAFVTYRDWDRYVERLERLRKVTKADVVAAAKKYLGKDHVAIWREKGKTDIPKIEKPEFTKIELDASRESPFFKDVVVTPAEPIEPRWLTPGKDYQSRTIPSGRIVWTENPVNDLFHIQFEFERGRRHARTLCQALNLLDLSGAGGQNAQEFKRELYRRGLKFSVGCGRERSSVSLSGLESEFDAALGLMRKRFAEPNVEKGILAKMVDVELGRHKDNKVNPGYVGMAVREFAYRGKDSDVLSELTDAELSALKEEELIAQLKTFFDYERRVSYVGVRSPEDVLKALEVPGKKYLPAPEPVPVVYVKPEKDTVLFVHRDMSQARVGMAAVDGVYDQGRDVDYTIYSKYMGDEMNSVVFQEVREARALAYSAWGGYAPGDKVKDENRAAGVLGTQADKTVEAATLLASLLRNMPASEERFAVAKNDLLETYRTNPTKFRAIPDTVYGWRDLGIYRDPRPKRMEWARDYTLSKLKDFAARFSKTPMTFYVLGDKARVGLDGIKKLGKFTEKSVDDIFPY